MIKTVIFSRIVSRSALSFFLSSSEEAIYDARSEGREEKKNCFPSLVAGNPIDDFDIFDS